MKTILTVFICIFFFQTIGLCQEDVVIEKIKIFKTTKKISLVFDLVNKSKTNSCYYIPSNIDACIGLIKLYTETLNQQPQEIPICDFILDLDHYKIDSLRLIFMNPNERKKIKLCFSDKIILNYFKKNYPKNIYLELNYNILKDYIENGESFYLGRIMSSKTNL
jgi:hypothetical protein